MTSSIPVHSAATAQAEQKNVAARAADPLSELKVRRCFTHVPDVIWQAFVGIDSFRGQQEAALQCLRNRKDAILVAPTGSGKSVVFQAYGASLDHGFALVVCPTNALIQNHLDELNALIKARGSDLQAKALGRAFCKPEQEKRILAMKKSSKIRWRECVQLIWCVYCCPRSFHWHRKVH